ncbi:UrcA family protein [Aurantiacibacter hainanensis]|uniref:UrcA family protein n=1 Tax=Aurantiacibacter hainanensis TaxID=3076114 RepID=UPI0033653565
MLHVAKGFIAAALIASLGMTLDASAKDFVPREDASRSIVVSLADLNLADNQDMQRLRARIDRAVRRLCPNRIEGPVKMYPDSRLCRQESWQDADLQLAEIREALFSSEEFPRSLAVNMVSTPRARK